MQNIATYRDTYAGEVAVTLRPFKTTRGGKPVTLYRWQEDARGFAPLGNVSGSVERMVHTAKRHPAFSNVTKG